MVNKCEHVGNLGEIPERKKVLVTQSCPILCDPMDYSLPGSSIHEILWARILDCISIPFSRGSSQPRDRTQVFCIAGRFFTVWATREAHWIFVTFICQGSSYVLLEQWGISLIWCFMVSWSCCQSGLIQFNKHLLFGLWLSTESSNMKMIWPVHWSSLDFWEIKNTKITISSLTWEMPR